jgi:hypothetical protein
MRLLAAKPYVEHPGDDAHIPIVQRRSLLDLDSRTCRWPVHDPAAPDFFAERFRQTVLCHPLRARLPRAGRDAHDPRARHGRRGMNHANKRMQALRAARKQPRQPAIGERARPTAQRIRHAGADFTRGDSGQITMRDSPLERAFARNVITPAQYAAGQKYRHHWYRAGLCDPLGSIDLNRIFAADLGSFSGMARTENQVFHRQRYREAVEAVGKIGSHVLESAVCREIALEQVGYSLGWGSRAQAYAAAAERMKDALDALCKLWGIG